MSDFEQDDDFWAESGSRGEGTRWARGDATPVSHYEFFMVVDTIERKLHILHERAQNIEERLVETRAKHFLIDLFVTGTGRFLLIVISLLSAFVVSRLGYGPFG